MIFLCLRRFGLLRPVFFILLLMRLSRSLGLSLWRLWLIVIILIWNLGCLRSFTWVLSSVSILISFGSLVGVSLLVFMIWWIFRAQILVILKILFFILVLLWALSTFLIIFFRIFSFLILLGRGWWLWRWNISRHSFILILLRVVWIMATFHILLIAFSFLILLEILFWIFWRWLFLIFLLVRFGSWWFLYGRFFLQKWFLTRFSLTLSYFIGLTFAGLLVLLVLLLRILAILDHRILPFSFPLPLSPLLIFLLILGISLFLQLFSIIFFLLRDQLIQWQNGQTSILLVIMLVLVLWVLAFAFWPFVPTFTISTTFIRLSSFLPFPVLALLGCTRLLTIIWTLIQNNGFKYTWISTHHAAVFLLLHKGTQWVIFLHSFFSRHIIGSLLAGFLIFGTTLLRILPLGSRHSFQFIDLSHLWIHCSQSGRYWNFTWNLVFPIFGLGLVGTECCCGEKLRTGSEIWASSRSRTSGLYKKLVVVILDFWRIVS